MLKGSFDAADWKAFSSKRKLAYDDFIYQQAVIQGIMKPGRSLTREVDKVIISTKNRLITLKSALSSVTQSGKKIDVVSLRIV